MEATQAPWHLQFEQKFFFHIAGLVKIFFIRFNKKIQDHITHMLPFLQAMLKTKFKMFEIWDTQNMVR